MKTKAKFNSTIAQIRKLKKNKGVRKIFRMFKAEKKQLFYDKLCKLKAMHNDAILVIYTQRSRPRLFLIPKPIGRNKKSVSKSISEVHKNKEL